MNNKVMDIYRPKNETLNDAFDRLVVTIHHQNRMFGHKTFVLTGCEPMVGTTTISINVAISLALSGLKTILIDGDLRKDGKYKRLNDTLEMGLSDVLAGNLDLASAICATNYVTLDYLPSGIKDENPVGLLYSPNLNEVIASLSEYYDYVIFDLPSANAAIDSNIFASKCDAVVLVAKQYSTSIMQIRNAKNELEKIAANLVGIVFNNVDCSEYRRYMKNYDYFNKGKFLKSKNTKNEMEISNINVNTSAFDLDYEKYQEEELDVRNASEIGIKVPDDTAEFLVNSSNEYVVDEVDEEAYEEAIGTGTVYEAAGEAIVTEDLDKDESDVVVQPEEIISPEETINPEEIINNNVETETEVEIEEKSIVTEDLDNIDNIVDIDEDAENVEEKEEA